MARQPGDAETEGDDALEAAAKRLERAVTLLDTRVKSLKRDADSMMGGLFDQDRSNLAEDLDKARGRQHELEDAGREASAALGRAITEIRDALGGPH